MIDIDNVYKELKDVQDIIEEIIKKEGWFEFDINLSFSVRGENKISYSALYDSFTVMGEVRKGCLEFSVNEECNGEKNIRYVTVKKKDIERYEVNVYDVMEDERKKYEYKRVEGEEEGD